MARRTRIRGWAKPAAGMATVGALAVLPALTGCAETANAAGAKLERFTSCAALTEYMQRNALENLAPYGFTGGVGGVTASDGCMGFAICGSVDGRAA